ncbi:MAG: GNAT family N-acetyltransferase [Rhodospirillaceae bacterium]|nr:GNAT family N-acetyltransferase [Rhodospirillaceae bacterium]
MVHILDRPIWAALTTRQTEFAVGQVAALRFAPDVEPFVATRDNDPENAAALGRLLQSGEQLYMTQTGEHVLPPGAIIEKEAPIVQMVAEKLILPDISALIVPLTDADAPEMLALATLTQPGPFKTRTHKLGNFWGVKHNGKLVAMAGQRMKAPGYTEVSGVCTHPDARGRGYAKILSAVVMQHILETGERAFLHAYETNTAAIKLYESLGFVVRNTQKVTVFRAA